MQTAMDMELILAAFLAILVTVMICRECWLFYSWLKVLREYRGQHAPNLGKPQRR